MVMTRSQFQSNILDDSMENLIVRLSSQINFLSANHPNLDLNELTSVINLLMQKTDSLNSEVASQCDALEVSQSEVQLLKTELEVQKELRAKEMNNSFKLQDDAEEEVSILKGKILKFEHRIQDLVVKCKDAELATNQAISDLKKEKEKTIDLLNRNKCLSDAISVANNNISVLSEKVVSLESIAARPWDKNLWLDDNTLNAYFEAMASIVHNENNIVFLGPSQTQLIKLCSLSEVAVIFDQLKVPMTEFVFCCLSNSESTNQDSGSHWSLLIIDISKCKAFHFDSLTGSNARAALTLAKCFNVEGDNVVEMPCFQQKNSFECGLNVLVNAKQILQFYCLDKSHNSELDEWWNSRRQTRLNRSDSDSLMLVPSDVPSESLEPVKKGTKAKNKTNKEKKVKDSKHEWTIVRSNKRGRKRVCLGAPELICRNKFEVLSRALDDPVLTTGSNSHNVETKSHSSNTRHKSSNGNRSWKAGLKSSGVREETKGMSNVQKCENSQKSSTCKSDNDTRGSFKHVLVIGDSMIRHVSPDLTERGATVECCPGARILHMKKVLLKYSGCNFDVIHLHVGTNNLRMGYRGGPGYNGGHGKREALHEMADLLFTVKSTFPNSKIYVNSILIRSDISYKPLYDFNEQLELMCNNFGVAFVEANCWVTRRHLARDGRHLNRGGVSRLASLFDAVIPAALRLSRESAADPVPQVGPQPEGDSLGHVSSPSRVEITAPAAPEDSGNGLVEACVLGS
jgi:hypothetical protein